MRIVIEFIRSITDIIKFSQISQKKKNLGKLAFYSQGAADWPHIVHLLEATLNYIDHQIFYITSSTTDPGLEYQHKNLLSFYIGEGSVRDYFFKNIDISFLFLTMPDIDCFQVKRSKHKVKYIYIPHSLVSLHMIYRNSAFKNYDMIACAGEHHLNEIKLLSEIDNHRPQKFIKLGYPRLDHLVKKFKLFSKLNNYQNMKTIVLAPSWGPHGVIESGLGFRIVKELLDLGHVVILRPHPQSVKFSRKQITQITESFDQHCNFKYENDMHDYISLFEADILITDWSGVALEFAFTTKRPIIYCDIPRKVNNPEYKLVNLEPIEVKLRDKIGVIWNVDTKLARAISECLSKSTKNIEEAKLEYVYNLGTSDQKFINFLKNELGF